MTPARLWAVLVVLLVIVLGSLMFAMAYYHDDSADQKWQFDLGMAVFQYGLIGLVVATVGAMIWTALSRRRPPQS